MRIIVVSLNYAPELTGIGKYTGQFCSWMQERGHQVKVFTTPPHYPNWHKVPYAVDNNPEKVEVVRLPVYIPSNPTFLRRLVYYVSFVVQVFVALKREGRKPDKPNVILLVAPTILAGLPVVHFARKWGIPSWVHVQDFEAETAAGLGILSSGVIKWAAVALEGRLLRRFLWATTVSLPMLAKLEKIRGASNSDVFPNWVEASNLQLRLASRSVRAGWNVPDNAFILLFTGSIARKQGITILVDLADRLASVVPPIFVVICGDGPEKVLLQERAQKVNNLKVFGLVPEEALPEVLATADIHILPQRPEVSDHVMPSKLLAMMASGRPVIATAPTGSAIADVLGDAGLTVPFDLDALANAVMMLAQDPDLRAKMGASGNMRAMAYEKDLVLCRIEQKMIERVNSHKV